MNRATRGAPDGPHRVSYQPAPAVAGSGNAIGASPTGRFRLPPLPRLHAAAHHAQNRLQKSRHQALEQQPRGRDVDVHPIDDRVVRLVRERAVGAQRSNPVRS
ncbi:MULTISPECIES: hypothetical protein, partial [unclassified Burkholderia]|uniref:hypothetical protein n=1 Tax=Burkholderia sp. LMG 13014 TaxID=2709306 RepID=UPI0019650255